MVGKWRHRQTCIASTSIAFSSPSYYLQMLSLTTASLPCCSLGAPPQHRVLLSLSLYGDVQLPELKLLCKPMKQRTGHRSLSYIAKPNEAWRGRTQPRACLGTLGCTRKPLRSGGVHSAHAARLRHRHTQQKHPRNDAHIKKKMVSSVSGRKLSDCQTTNKLETFPSLILLDTRPEPSSFFSSSLKGLA